MITTVLAFVTVFLRAGVVELPDRQRARRRRARPRARRRRDRPHGELPAHRRGRDRPRHRRAGDRVRDRPRPLRVPGPVRHHRRRPAARTGSGAGSRVDDQAVSSWQAAREVRPIPTELQVPPDRAQCANIALYGAIALFVLSLPLWLSNSKLADRDRDRHHRHHRGLARHAHRLGRPREPRSDGVRRDRRRGRRVGHAGRGLGPRLRACSPAARPGAVVAVVIGIPAARAGGLTLAVTTLALAPAVLYWLLNPEFFDWLPRGRFEPTRSCSARIDDPVADELLLPHARRSSRSRSRWRTASGAAAPGACSSRCARTRGPRRRTASTRCARCWPASRSPASSPRRPACCSCTTST